MIGAGTSGHGFKFGPLLGEMLADLAMGQEPAVGLERFSARRPTVADVTALAVLLAAVPTAAQIWRNQRPRPSPAPYRPNIASRLKTRTWPICATVVLFCFAMAYFFKWGPTVQHLPYWENPGDLWRMYAATNAVLHGHFGAIYAPGNTSPCSRAFS